LLKKVIGRFLRWRFPESSVAYAEEEEEEDAVGLVSELESRCSKEGSSALLSLASYLGVILHLPLQAQEGPHPAGIEA
jgi:hypothetical protein